MRAAASAATAAPRVAKDGDIPLCLLPLLDCPAQSLTSLGRPAEVITADPANNIPDNIYQRMGANLHHQPTHPLGIIKDAIYKYFDDAHPGMFRKFDDLHPIVTIEAVSRRLKLNFSLLNSRQHQSCHVPAHIRHAFTQACALSVLTAC